MKILLSTLALVAPQSPDAPVPLEEGKSITAKEFVIVGTTAPRALRAGAEVLEAGGSAVDAALTTALAQTTLCAGCWVSFAGRMTAVVYDAESGEVVALNACYDAPRGEDDPITIPRQPTPSGRTVLVPGFMAGVGALHDRFGSRPFESLFTPSIRLAEEGFELTPSLAHLIRGKREVLLRTPGGRDVFLDADGELFVVGSQFRQPALGRTLRRVAKGGASEFYTGEWARKFVEEVQGEGGKLSLEDLAAYQPTWEVPDSVEFMGNRVYGLPTPNRGGPSALMALNLASAAGFGSGEVKHASAQALQGVERIETATDMVWGSRGRAALASHSDKVPSLWEESFGHAEGGAALWQLAQSEEWPDIVEEAFGLPQTGGHSDAIVAVDKHGNVIAMLHTINTAGWGTTGLFVDGVSIPDSGASQQRSMLAVGPGGRMPDHGAPILALRDGKPVFASSATGSGLVDAIWQKAIDVLAFGRDPADAADAPTLHRGQVERGAFPRETLEGARGLGASLEVIERFGGFQRGFWVGVTLDPLGQGMRAAAEGLLDGVAVGR